MRHIIPNSVYPIFVQMSLDVGTIPLLLGTLVYLGFPVFPTIYFPEWGSMAALSVYVVRREHVHRLVPHVPVRHVHHPLVAVPLPGADALPVRDQCELPGGRAAGCPRPPAPEVANGNHGSGRTTDPRDPLPSGRDAPSGQRRPAAGIRGGLVLSSERNPVVLDVRDLKTYFFTYDGVVKALDGVSFKVRRERPSGWSERRAAGRASRRSPSPV